LLLAACGTEEDPSQPLPPVYISEQLFGHTIEATTSGGAHYLLRFDRSDYAERIAETSEFVRWYTAADRGLCLEAYGAAPVCAPLYQINVQHFRWGDTLFSDLSIPDPGFGGGHGLR
jgi:hypothetical protein